MSWIRTDVDLATHPKTLKFAAAIRAAGEGARLGPKPHAWLDDLWRFTRKFAPDGNLCSFDAGDIALGAGWDGPPGVFMSALKDAKLIEEGKDGWEIHDWWEHNGQHLREAEKKRRQREAEKLRKAGKGHPSTVPGTSPGHPTVSPGCPSDGTGRDVEDVTTDTDLSGSATPAGPDPVPKAKKPRRRGADGLLETWLTPPDRVYRAVMGVPIDGGKAARYFRRIILPTNGHDKAAMDVEDFCNAFFRYLTVAKKNGWRVDYSRFADEAGKWTEKTDDEKAIDEERESLRLGAETAAQHRAIMDQVERRQREEAAKNG